MFVSMGLSAIFPVLHGLRLYGADELNKRIGLVWLVLQGALYILGAGIYAVSSEHVISRKLMNVKFHSLNIREQHNLHDYCPLLLAL